MIDDPNDPPSPGNSPAAAEGVMVRSDVRHAETEPSPADVDMLYASPLLSRDSETKERVASSTKSSDSGYGSDPFKGLTTRQLDTLTTASQSKGTAAGNARMHDYEDLRPKLKSLQDEIFQTLLPENGFPINPEINDLASASDRFQAAAEILHVRASESEPHFEQHTISVLGTVPPGLEWMKSVQKLSPVFGNFSGRSQIDLADIATECAWNDTAAFDERVQAQKFLSIVRDHANLDWQRNHEAFSRHLRRNLPKEIAKNFIKKAEQELLEDFASEIQERASMENQLSQDNFGAIVNRVEFRSGALKKHVSTLTKDQVVELRQSAYQLRRVMEQLDFAKPPVAEIDSQDRGSLNSRDRSQAADVTVAARAGDHPTREQKPSPNSLPSDNHKETSSTLLRQELKGANRERSLER
ncbi:hypothetical protein ACCS93_34955 [Rhizobium ruizarguesonis]